MSSKAVRLRSTNAINQHQRLIGKTHSGGKGVRLGVASAQGLCDAAYGKVHALVAGKGTANLGQYLFYVGSEKEGLSGGFGFPFPNRQRPWNGFALTERSRHGQIANTPIGHHVQGLLG